MARQHRIEIFCDYCLEVDDVEVEGEETPPITIGNNKPKVMALCKQHREDFYEPFAEALRRLGILAEKLGTGAPKIVKAGGAKADGDGGAMGPKTFTELANGYQLPRGISASKADEYRVVCPVPDCRVLLKNAHTASGHLRDIHHTSLFDVIGREGVLHDIDGNPVDTPKPRPYNGQGKRKVS